MTAKHLSICMLLALCMLGIVPASHATTYGQHYGVVDQWGGGGGTGPGEIIMQNLGAKWIRSGWDWNLIEGLGDDQYDPVYLGLMDDWVVAMNAIGVNILYGFSYTPAWARPGGTGHNTPPTNPAKYTEFITFMVNRYKSSIKHWGLWNEPNIDGFWNGTDDNYIHNFLIPGIAAIKAADPTAKTVVGELASCCNEYNLLQTFLTEINAHGEKGLVDVVCVHAYGEGDTASGRIARMDTLHNMMIAQGWGDKDFWCTETSWDGRGTTSGEATQASQIVAFMQGMDTRPWWKKTFYFTLTEGGGASQGLIRSDLSLKPAYIQYQALIADRADNAEIVSDTIPATMVAGRQYVVSVTVKNTGTATWSYEDEHRLGAVGDSDPFAAGRQYMNPGETVVPDATRTFWIPMTAPGTTGSYTTDWQMVHEAVHWFGHPLTKQVTVNNGPDTTAPGPVTGFAATMGDLQTTLTWTNPLDADFTKTMIRYKTTGYPTGPTDGTLLVDKANNPGTSDTYLHPGLTHGRTYYYAAFAHDVVPNYSTSATASVLARDAVAPAAVSLFAASAGNAKANLSWQNPTDSDFVGTVVRCRTTGGYPTGPTDGTFVCNKTGAPGSTASYLHTGLTPGTVYCYSAFTYDEVTNYSAAAQVSTLPWSEPCLFDDFSCSDGPLVGCHGWVGSASSKIAIAGGVLKIIGGAGAVDATYPLGCSDHGTGVISVDVKIRQGVGTSTIWNLWIDDPTTKNLARWFGSGTQVRGRIGATSALTSTYNLTGEWDDLCVKIYPAMNQSQFLFNGAIIGTYSHSSTGAGDTIGGIRFESISAGDAGQFVWFDDLRVGLADDCSVASLKALANNTVISLGNKALYCRKAGYGYVEEPTRASGIRVEGTIASNEGDTVYLTGTMKTTTGGERYILLSAMSTSIPGSVRPLAANNRDLKLRNMDGLFVKTWGAVKAGSIVGNSYVLTDGSDSAGIKVITPGAPSVSVGQFVTVQGAAGWESARVVYE